jgi:transcriptional regulator GlxA family with amidase domain
MEQQAYTVQEVAALMGLSTRTVTRLFEKERGVIILEHPGRMHKRLFDSEG